MVNIQTIENRFFCILYTVILSISYTKKTAINTEAKLSFAPLAMIHNTRKKIIEKIKKTRSTLVTKIKIKSNVKNYHRKT